MITGAAVLQILASVMPAILILLKQYFSNQRVKQQISDDAQQKIQNGDVSGIIADLDNLNRLR